MHWSEGFGIPRSDPFVRESNQYELISHAADGWGQADLVSVMQHRVQSGLLPVDENQFHVFLGYRFLGKQLSNCRSVRKRLRGAVLVIALVCLDQGGETFQTDVHYCFLLRVD